jgi:hypothetical protein
MLLLVPMLVVVVVVVVVVLAAVRVKVVLVNDRSWQVRSDGQARYDLCLYQAQGPCRVRVGRASVFTGPVKPRKRLLQTSMPGSHSIS